MTKDRSPGETTMVISLPEELKREVQAYCAQRDITVSKFIRDLIREHLGLGVRGVRVKGAGGPGKGYPAHKDQSSFAVEPPTGAPPGPSPEPPARPLRYGTSKRGKPKRSGPDRRPPEPQA